jgi:methionyl-tRNA formyltransferase
VETLRELAAEEVTPQPQDDSLATSAPLLKKEDGLIDWHLTATEVLNRWRGFSPWPGIYTFFRNEQLKLKGLRIADDIPASDSPGTIHISQNHELLVSCGKATTAEIVSAQMPGRKAVAGADLINGLRIREGEVMDAK